MALRHSALPEALAVAQGAVFMPLEALVVYIGDHSGAAAVTLLGAIVLLLRGVAGDRQACWCLSRGFHCRRRGRDCRCLRTRHRKAMGLLLALFPRVVLGGEL